MQAQLNLLYREEEREMLPLCKAEGNGILPWSPMARGRLTRKWDETTEHQENDEFGKMRFAKTRGRPARDRAGGGSCEARGVSRGRSRLPGCCRSRRSAPRSLALQGYSISMT